VVLVGVISAEGVQAVFPSGKANPIAAANCGTTPPRLAIGVSGSSFWGTLDSQAVASIMRSALDTKGAFGNRELTNGNEPNVSEADAESFPYFPSSRLNTYIYEYNP
jgi:hypothetical protein